MKTVKILFQGDSITDAGRDYANPHNLGNGYPAYAAQALQEKNPDISFEFVNLGISGNQTKDLVDRVQSDFVDIQPDIVSILVGINDVWHHVDQGDWIPNAQFEANFRVILEKIKNETNAKIMLMEPFVLPSEWGSQWRKDDLSQKIDVIRKMAIEYADAFLPTDGLLHTAYIGDDPITYLADGVHLTQKGAEYVGALYAQFVQKLIDAI